MKCFLLFLCLHKCNIIIFTNNINGHILLKLFACWDILHDFLSSTEFFKINFFQIILSGIPSECPTVWIWVRLDVLSGLTWVQTVCKNYQQTANFVFYDTCFMFIWTDFNFTVCGCISIKQTNFAFSCITDMSLVLPNRQDGNVKRYSHNTAALNTSPSPLTDFKS